MDRGLQQTKTLQRTRSWIHRVVGLRGGILKATLQNVTPERSCDTFPLFIMKIKVPLLGGLNYPFE